MELTNERSFLQCMRGRLLTAALVVALPQVAACGATPPTAPDAETLETPTDTTGQWTVRTGTFTGLAGHLGSGGVRVRMKADTVVVEFQSDFASTPVPGPYVYLNDGTDANKGNPVRIDALKSASGGQTYAAVVPADLTYEYVLVWCDPFNVGVASAKLSP